uniref:CRAL-TRIO domain-containing protein n=1 Tax=viral metagenome TaxID=1070528 RepID=A0A6C0ETL7_9ZZZZ
MSVEKYVEFTQVANKGYRILLFNVKFPHPTPLQWAFTMNELKEHLECFKELKCRFAFIFEAKNIGIISTSYVLEFIQNLVSYEVTLESNLIASSVIYEGGIINTLFELIKVFYKTKKPIEFVKNMKLAIDFIDNNL